MAWCRMAERLGGSAAYINVLVSGPSRYSKLLANKSMKFLPISMYMIYTQNKL